jgi:hypothetical protein
VRYAIAGIGYCCAMRSVGEAMLYRKYFLHYKLVREALTAVATIGTALLFSYLILQAHF